MIAAARAKLALPVRRLLPVLVTLGLLLLVISISASVIASNVSDVRLSPLWLAMLVSLGVAWLLGRTRLPDWAGLAIVALLGLGAALIWTGRLAQPLYALLSGAGPAFLDDLSAWLLATSLRQWLQTWPLSLPDYPALAAVWGEFAAASGPPLQGAGAWLASQARGSPTYNPVGAGMFWMTILWALAGWAGWWVLHRRNGLAGVLPLTFLAAWVVAFSGGDWLPLVVILIAALFLSAWLQYHQRLEAWLRAGRGYSEETRADMAIAALVVIALIATFAFLAATLPVEDYARRLQQVVRPRPQALQQAGEALGIDQGQPAGPGAGSGQGSLPRSHLLGAAPELLQTEVLFIQTSEPPPDPQAASQPGESPYWRGQAYDVYTGHGWATSPTQVQALRRTRPVDFTGGPYYQEFEQQVRLLGASGGTVYHAGELTGVDSAAALELRSTPPGENSDLFAATTNDEDYRAASLRLMAGEDVLQAAVQEAPAWIRERYLQLPDDIPPRLLELAADITQQAATPYERALAIESYLRSFPYTLDVAAPPAGRDVADYFLFDLRQGYCDYYATAMTVLARLAGLPARYVSGYASGSYDPARQGYLVREANAHAWVEIYFSGVGWETFEPTAGLPAIERPPTTTPSGQELAEQAGTQAAPPDLGWLWKPLAGLAAFAMACLLAGLAWLGWERWRLRRMAPELALNRLYASLCHLGRRMGVAHQAGDTPFEYGEALNASLAGLGAKRSWAAIPLPVRTQIDELIDLYSMAIYSPLPPEKGRVRRTIQGYVQVRLRLLLAWLASRAASKRS
jgi:hypothetical protein